MRGAPFLPCLPPPDRLRLLADEIRHVGPEPRARRDGPLLLADETQALGERTIRPSDTGMLGDLRIEPGERTIFTLRAVLPGLPDVVLVLCGLDSIARRPFTTYRDLYSRWRPTRRVTRRSGAQPSGSDRAEAAGDREEP